jgi:hypothetical protein
VPTPALVITRFQLPDPASGSEDFEEGSGAMPDGWGVDQWEQRSAFTWEQAGVGRDGSRCVSIETIDPDGNDARWTRTLQLTPEGWYSLSGWVRGERLSNATGDLAANLSLMDSWQVSSSGPGTFDWTKLDLTLQANVSGEVTIACRLGCWGSLVTGKAYFDDLTITPLTRYEGQHHYLILEEADIAASGISDAALAGWQARLDQVYEAYAQLVGDVPFDGQRIGIAAVRQYPGGWAVAGNPIRWHQPYVSESLYIIANEGDWSFGVVHELGHDFDLDYRWVWDAELLANVKLESIVEALDATVVFDGQSYQGEELRDVFAASYAEARSRGEYNWAVIHVRFAELRDDYGWELFQQAFRAYPAASDPACPVSRLDKFLLFIDILSQISGADIQARFEEGEWEWMTNDLSE